MNKPKYWKDNPGGTDARKLVANMLVMGGRTHLLMNAKERLMPSKRMAQKESWSRLATTSPSSSSQQQSRERNCS
jgi:hypothetical protein